MTGERSVLVRALAVASAAWVWCVMQWLANGVGTHAHVDGHGAVSVHQHGWTGPGVFLTGVVLVGLFVAATVRVERRQLVKRADRRAAAWAGAAIAAAACTVLEVTEQMLDADHRSLTHVAALVAVDVLSVVVAAATGVLAVVVTATLVSPARRAELPVRVARRGQWAVERSGSAVLHTAQCRRRGPPMSQGIRLA